MQKNKYTNTRNDTRTQLDTYTNKEHHEDTSIHI